MGLSATLWSAHSSCRAALWEDALHRPGGGWGVRGDGCRKTQELSEIGVTIWAFWDRVTKLSPGVMAMAEGTLRIPAQGQEVDVSTALLASLLSPLDPSL